jgi:protein-tyrosine phosphatase
VGKKLDSRARDAFEVVFLCTGNRARSPFAAALLRQHVTSPELRIRSAGTVPTGGVPALESAIRLGRKYGVDLSAHRSRALERNELASADLVIGFEPAHLATAIVDGGASVERTFTLIELTDLLAAATEGSPDARAMVRAVHARRSPNLLTAQPIADPFGKSDASVLEIFDVVDVRTAALAATLFSGEGPKSGFGS